jgi:hypothetical protein
MAEKRESTGRFPESAPLWRQDAARYPLPVPCDAKWTVPDSRWPVLSHPKGESGPEWVHSSMGATRKPCARRSEGFACSFALCARSCESTGHSNGPARNEGILEQSSIVGSRKDAGTTAQKTKNRSRICSGPYFCRLHCDFLLRSV